MELEGRGALSCSFIDLPFFCFTKTGYFFNFRYRDKKKSELLNVESVEQTLADKNKGLKSEVADLEVKVRTMKQLMVELGILKA